MPWEAISRNAGFFGAILGAVAGGSGVWAATKQWMKNKDKEDGRRDAAIEDLERELDALRISRGLLITKEECDREHGRCQRVLCTKIEDLRKIIRGDREELRDTMKADHLITIENARTLAAIQEHLRGLEKRFDEEREVRMKKNGDSKMRHSSVV